MTLKKSSIDLLIYHKVRKVWQSQQGEWEHPPSDHVPYGYSGLLLAILYLNNIDTICLQASIYFIRLVRYISITYNIHIFRETKVNYM